MVDAGSSGSATFAAFPRHILPNSHTEVMSFLHICQTGLATNPDIIAAASIDLDATLRVASEHTGLIRGVKARMVSPVLEILGREMPRLANARHGKASCRSWCTSATPKSGTTRTSPASCYRCWSQATSSPTCSPPIRVASSTPMGNWCRRRGSWPRDASARGSAALPPAGERPWSGRPVALVWPRGNVVGSPTRYPPWRIRGKGLPSGPPQPDQGLLQLRLHFMLSLVAVRARSGRVPAACLVRGSRSG